MVNSIFCHFDLSQLAPFHWLISSLVISHLYHHLTSSQSLNLGGRRGTTDDVSTIPFHPSLSSAPLRESPNPISVHSLMLSSHLFCLPLLLSPFTVPCRIVFAMPELSQGRESIRLPHTHKITLLKKCSFICSA